MSASPRDMLSRSRFLFWGITPPALLLMVLFNLSVDMSEPSRVAVVAVVDVSVALLCLGLYHPVRFRWTLWLLTGILIAAGLASWVITPALQPKVTQSLVVLLIVGIPALLYGLRSCPAPLVEESFPVLLADSKDDSVLRGALNKVLDAPRGPQSAACVNALTAAEVIAAMRGGPVDVLPARLQPWPATRAHLCTPELVDLAHRAVSRVAAQSPLQEAWQGGGESTVFQQKIRDLQDHLQAAKFGPSL